VKTPYIPSNEEAWDFAVRALWEHYWELRAGAKGPGVVLTPAEADRLAHNIVFPKRPRAGRPPRNAPPHPLLKALTDLQARLLAGILAGENLTLSAAECELLAANIGQPNRQQGRIPSKNWARDKHLAEDYRLAYERTGSSKLAVAEVEEQWRRKRSTILTAHKTTK
jgi:hypothetical protein